MTNRRLHRLAGIVLLAPLITWALTGIVFLLQPGYGGAYEMLGPRTYPLQSAVTLSPDARWTEYRLLRTLLGEHLLVRTEAGWQHLEAGAGTPWSRPDEAGIRALIGDAIAEKSDRYGEVLDFEDGAVITSTGIRITLNWETLSLRQYGNDTRWIDRLYRLHYLQWTGFRALDKVLGVIGLLLLVLASVSGFRLLIGRRQ